tara:strand:- start:2984 stop:3784 length:801 start_codon:yes stop_codon:yes gene_type:complete
MIYNNTLVLFDVDGTLTDARQPITMPVIVALRELCRSAEIGFLTGSGMDYIKEQLWPAFNDLIIRENCHILPCNGTEYAVPIGVETLGFQSLYKASMSEYMGEKKFYRLMKILCTLQAKMVEEEYNIPLAGNMFQNRVSMINWCPIGRNGNSVERSQFKALDKLYGIRKKYINILKDFCREEELEVVIKLGGDTSFDIYPPGWDKTYALRHFDQNQWDFWFIGDRCSPEGNDFEIFNLLKPKGRAFETGSPEETVEIIDFHILKEI